MREAMKWEQTGHQYSSLSCATAKLIEELEGEREGEGELFAATLFHPLGLWLFSSAQAF